MNMTAQWKKEICASAVVEYIWINEYFMYAESVSGTVSL